MAITFLTSRTQVEAIVVHCTSSDPVARLECWYTKAREIAQSALGQIVPAIGRAHTQIDQAAKSLVQSAQGSDNAAYKNQAFTLSQQLADLATRSLRIGVWVQKVGGGWNQLADVGRQAMREYRLAGYTVSQDEIEIGAMTLDRVLYFHEQATQAARSVVQLGEIASDFNISAQGLYTSQQTVAALEQRLASLAGHERSVGALLCKVFAGGFFGEGVCSVVRSVNDALKDVGEGIGRTGDAVAWLLKWGPVIGLGFLGFWLVDRPSQKPKTA